MNSGGFALNGRAAHAAPRMLRLSIITKETMTMRPAIHPGEILAEELEEITVTPTELARQLRVPANRMTQIIQGKRAITGDTALRLGHWFGTSAQFWLNLQSAYDIRVAKQSAGAEIARLPKRRATVTGGGTKQAAAR
jgi:addiction module HigA family antidote